MKSVPSLAYRLLVLTLLAGAALPLSGRHLVGGDLTYRCLGINAQGLYDYEISINLYRDCVPNNQFATNTPFDNNIVLYFFSAADNSVVGQVLISRGDSVLLPLTVADTCVPPPTGLCYLTTTYRTRVLVPANPAGYYISWGRCCRNETIVNINSPGGTGMAITGFIPNTALCNNSPTFNNLLPAFICVNDDFEFDHSATDTDGDSLVYLLTAPFGAGSQNDFVPIPTPPPYGQVSFRAPFTTNNPMGGNPALALNPQTGLLTVRPTQLGQYVFSISVLEYRNGTLISEVKRDIQVNVIDCPINFPPRVERPTGNQVNGDTLSFFQGEENCFNFRFTDNNGAGLPNDLLRVNTSGAILGGGTLPPPFGTFPGGNNLTPPYASQLCWAPPCDYDASGITPILMRVEDTNDCPGPNVTFDTMYVRVLPGKASPPQLRCVSVGGPSRIDLTWQALPNSDRQGFDAYYLYRNDGSGWALLAEIADPAQTTYTDNAATNAYGQAYCYRLATAKICPNFFVSDPGNEVCSIFTVATPVSQIQSQISWNTYSGWSNPTYALLGNEGTETLIEGNLTATSYLFTDCDFVGTFRVRTVDPVTGCEAYSAPTSLVRQVDAPPQVVEFCRVTVSDASDGILLEWIPSTDDDLVAVRILRKPRSSGAYQVIHESTDLLQSSYLDEAVNVDAESYCYLLEYEDFCGNLATSEPDCSILLTGEGVEGQIAIGWTPYEGWDRDVSTYEVWDLADQPLQVATFENQINSFTNSSLPPAQARFCYRIIAREGAGGCGLESQSNQFCVTFPPRFFLPNAFSPNGDGHNDRFEIKGLFISFFELRIFNRWGTEVFYSDSPDNAWDGNTSSGGQAQEGVYIYLLRIEGFDGISFERSGSVTLIR